MANTPQCGERRCTIEGAETQVRAYREGYNVHVQRISKAGVDDLHPAMTRVKTEIDEMHELVQNAKQKGASAWESVKDTVQAGLDKLGANYHAVIHHDQPKK